MKISEQIRRAAKPSAARLKFVGKLHASERIFIAAFVSHMLKGQLKGMKITLRARKGLGKNFGYVRHDDLGKGSYDVYFDSSPGISALTLGYVAHELTHVLQYVRGDLSFKGDTFIWKGKPAIKAVDYNKLSHAQYAKLPWELEAIKNQKTKGREFVSTRLKDLKGRDPTLDYIIDNNLL